MKAKVLELIKGYLARPDVRQDELTMSVLNCLAGDVMVLEEPVSGHVVTIGEPRSE
jgi:hypothetical protein